MKLYIVGKDANWFARAALQIEIIGRLKVDEYVELPFHRVCATKFSYCDKLITERGGCKKFPIHCIVRYNRRRTGLGECLDSMLSD